MEGIRIKLLAVNLDESDCTLDQLSDLSNAIDELLIDMGLEGVIQGELETLKR